MIEGYRVLISASATAVQKQGHCATTGKYVSKGDAMSDSRQPDCYRCHGLSLGSPLCYGRWPCTLSNRTRMKGLAQRDSVHHQRWRGTTRERAAGRLTLVDDCSHFAKGCIKASLKL